MNPLMVEALTSIDFRYPLSEGEQEILFNSTPAERREAATQHARAAALLYQQAQAVAYAATMLGRWWRQPGATLRDALQAAPPELAETVTARLQEAGFTVDLGRR